MKNRFETTLESPWGAIDGIFYEMNPDGSAWEFKSIDGALQLIIAKDDEGNWQRIAGTEPYLSSWIDELSDYIKSHQ